MAVTFLTWPLFLDILEAFEVLQSVGGGCKCSRNRERITIKVAEGSNESNIKVLYKDFEVLKGFNE